MKGTPHIPSGKAFRKACRSGFLLRALPVLGLILIGAAAAQEGDRAGTDQNAVRQADTSDIERGRSIAMSGEGCGGPGPCLACYTCHGREGEGDPALPVPRLAGQAHSYLVKALRDYASGLRVDETMQEVAAALDEEAMRDVAAFYSLAEPDTDLAAAAAQALLDPAPDRLVQGGALAAYGDMRRGIQACINCHGPEGQGLPPTYPYLAGQYAGYLQEQLMAWRTGERSGDPFNVMLHIALRMTEEQIEAVAEYYASVRPTDPVPSFAATAGAGETAPAGQEETRE